jgi:hypothetical protein
MKYCLMLVQWMVLATVVAAAPQPSKPRKPDDGNRFLFILETSSGMTQLEHGGRQAIFDLIHSGVDGRMQAGDTYGIWPFNEQVYSGLVPMQTWDPQKRLDHASAIGRYLRTHKYEKDGNFEVLVKQIQAVVRGAKDVNILVVTDGNTAFAGTPFDKTINAAFETNRALVHVAKKPLVVTFVAREGELKAACVTPAGDKIDLAEFTRVTNALPETVQAPTEPLASQVTRAPNAAPVDMSRALIMRGPKSTNTGAAVTMPPAATTVTHEPVAATTNEAPSTTAAEPAKAPTTTGVTVASAPAPAASETRNVQAPEPLPSFVPAQVKASARTVQAPISVIAPPTGNRTSAWPNFLLLIGGACVGASAIGAFFFLRKVRNAKEPSFISQGLDRR